MASGRSDGLRKRSRSRLAALPAAIAAAWIATAGAVGAAEPKVVVTIKPIHSLAASVMAGAGSPELLLDGAASPHAYALKPSDARRLAAADVVVRVSEQLETFLNKTLAGLSSRVRVITLGEVPGLALLPLRAGDGFEAHAHGKGGHDKAHGGGHRHKPVRGQSHAGIDSHIWLDPGNGRRMALHLAEVLASVAPGHAALYRRNAAALAARLDALAESLVQETQPLAGRPYVVFHDAYQYFERRFGLPAAAAVTVSPEVPPSAQRIARIRALLAAKGAACVFAEPQFPPKLIDTIVEGTGVRRGVLDPLGAALEAGPDHYTTLLEALARDLKGCLGDPS